jgi:hypothetical protein
MACWLFWFPITGEGQMVDPPSEQEFAALACGLTRYTMNQPAFAGDARPLLVVSGTVAGRIGPEWLEECPEDLSVWDRSEGFSFLIPAAAVARFGDDGEDGAFLVYLRDPME